jgi:hypothetical protein
MAIMPMRGRRRRRRRLVYVAEVGLVAFVFVTSSAASRRDRDAAV